MTRRGSKPLPPTASAGMVQALAALYKGGPLSREERREFEASKDRQRVRDEQARAPQPDLLDGEGAPSAPKSRTCSRDWTAYRNTGQAGARAGRTAAAKSNENKYEIQSLHSNTPT